MFNIAEEDIGKLIPPFIIVANHLSNGAKKSEQNVFVGDEISPITLTGYWAKDECKVPNDIMRIDIKRRTK